MESEKDLGGFFAVSPKYDCPHVSVNLEALAGKHISIPCEECGDARENWICLECGTIACSRFVNEHMVNHAQQTSHPIVLSFTDLSFWCYNCESYIVSNDLRPILKVFQDQKFPNLNNNS
jgi:uncharacterized UBP type Zn finger protein